ncbi:Flp family type IVb pilin [Notoacmeibacter sp. MSK16QG-6]|uniref:Flp family type IVb pilin n=1 Tax=Notoacmeibacter sp. MSK16QG-6 TaxID=2957982 RepID=UPI0020A0482C|nr:Flp family type IVb pilin [Notoacmeibacter sp. MSK16QG-6]
MTGLLRRFLGDNRGATVIEYGLLCSLLAVLLFISIQASGGRAMSIISVVASAIGGTD